MDDSANATLIHAGITAAGSIPPTILSIWLVCKWLGREAVETGKAGERLARKGARLLQAYRALDIPYDHADPCPLCDRCEPKPAPAPAPANTKNPPRKRAGK